MQLDVTETVLGWITTQRTAFNHDTTLRNLETAAVEIGLSAAEFELHSQFSRDTDGDKESDESLIREAARTSRLARARRKLEMFAHQVSMPDLEREVLEFRPPAKDEVTLWFRCHGTGENKMVKLHKGMQPRGLPDSLHGRESSQRVLTGDIAMYIRNLTDLYKLHVPYWEVMECARKAFLQGIIVTLKPGLDNDEADTQTINQISLALVASMLFT